MGPQRIDWIGGVWGMYTGSCAPKSKDILQRTPGFEITFARRYRWQTESWEDQETFLIAAVRLFRKLNGGQSPQLIGWKMPDAPMCTFTEVSTTLNIA